jgi:CheY-like chemotaxis protein
LKTLGRIQLGTPDKIESTKKKVLLIDDEADMGWEDVLRKLFKTSNNEDFVVIKEKVKDYDSLTDSSKEIIEKQVFDLYLIDLRLNGLQEDENVNTAQFSGMKILQKIKSLNEGNQVIIFTASNKVWNLQALLEAGADSYYMKESPEYNLSEKNSKNNFKVFKQNVLKCFEKKYLREVYVHWDNAKRKNTDINSDFIKESNIVLQMAWEQMKNGYLDFAFLTLYKCIESFADSIFKYDMNTGTSEVGGITVIEIVNDQESLCHLKYHKEQYNKPAYCSVDRMIVKNDFKPTTLFKVSSVLHFVYGKNNGFLEQYGELNKLRNNIAHNTKGKVNSDNIVRLLNLIEEFRIN